MVDGNRGSELWNKLTVEAPTFGAVAGELLARRHSMRRSLNLVHVGRLEGGTADARVAV
jgi:hypothetical protein